MYKIFEVTYNDGDWHSGDLPHFFYIAESKEDVITHSTKYQEYLDMQTCRHAEAAIFGSMKYLDWYETSISKI